VGRAEERDAWGRARAREAVVVDVRDARAPRAFGDAPERLLDVGEELEPGEGVEVPLDEARIAREPEMGEALLERALADRAIGAVGLPVMRDVPVLPVLPELAHVEMRAAALLEDRSERRVGARAHVDERAEDVEGNERGAELRCGGHRQPYSIGMKGGIEDRFSSCRVHPG